MKRFKFLDHTGDLAMEVYGQNLTDLFENAGQALFSVITDPSEVKDKVEREVDLTYDELGTLMVDWLTELLYLHDVEGLLFGSFKVGHLGAGQFLAKAWGEFFKEEKHLIRTEVKAVTFHQLEVTKQGGTWRARVILDL
ncbi:MAG: archease [Proteobacteria bacterium]|nr:archease [Pseudomonadota bacterium]